MRSPPMLPRATGGLDIWVRPSLDNARRVLDALRTFQVPLHDLSEDDLARPGTVFQIGVVPNRIDILTERRATAALPIC